MKKKIKRNLLIVLLLMIAAPNFLKVQVNIDSTLKTYIDFFRTSEYGNNDSVGKYYDIRGIQMYVEVYGQGEP
jgi:hypothetical protein